MDNKLLYDRPVEEQEESLHREHKKVLEWTGSGKNVLEIGCHTGYISAWLQKKSNRVTGVELYEPALQKASAYQELSIVGDIETNEVWEQLKNKKFDVVILMHILEHLTMPDVTLLKIKDILIDTGVVIIGLPNISNWIERKNHIKGNFNYEETGVMDKTHLRFYNYFTAQNLITEAGFKIVEYYGESNRLYFNIFHKNSLTGRINDYFNRLIHKLTSPNFTDRVLMFKITKAV